MKHILFTILSFLLFYSGYSQNIETEVAVESNDSVQVQKLDISNLPIRSASARTKTIQISQNAEMDTLVFELSKKSVALFTEVDTLLIGYDTTTINTHSIRFLENRKILLESEKVKLNKFIDEVSSVVNRLTENIQYLTEERIFWTNLNENGEHKYLQEAFSTDEIFASVEEAQKKVRGRMKTVIDILNIGAELQVRSETQGERIKAQAKEIESQLLQGKYDPLYSLKWGRQDLSILQYLIEYTRNEKFELNSYCKSRKEKVAFILVILIVTLTVMVFYRRRLVLLLGIKVGFRERIALRSIKNPISTSILFAAFISVIILQDKPLALRDFMGYMLILPIINMMVQCFPKRYQIFTIIMVAITVLHLFYVALPASNIIFRFNLLLLAIIEFLASRHLIKLAKHREVQKHRYRTIAFKRIGQLYLILASISIVGNFFGQVYLAQIIQLSIYISFIAGIWIFVLVNLFQVLAPAIINGPQAQKVNYIKNNKDLLKSRIKRLLGVIGIVFWISSFLIQLHLWNNLKQFITAILTEKYTIGSISFSFGTIIIFMLVIYLSTVLARFIQEVMEGDILNKAGLPKGVPYTISVITRYSIITIGVLFAVSAAGLELSSLTIIIGAFSVGIGFGLQNIFNNLVSGLILLFERPVQIGDTIEVGDLLGTVKSIGIRSSNVSTVDGAEVIVPNGNLISNEVVNWTLSNQRRRIEIIAGVSYDSDPHFVKELLEKVVNTHPDIMKYPAPEVLFNEMADSSLNFRILVWTASYDKWIRIRSELTFQIFDILGENDIEIPFPQRDVHMKTKE